ncbi:transposon-transfer assisting family protein [Lachnospiraceae bacterium 29-84]
MNHNFTVEEVNLICVFAGESRSEVIEDIERALPYLEDTDMLELTNRVIGRLRNMTDDEFLEQNNTLIRNGK